MVEFFLQLSARRLDKFWLRVTKNFDVRFVLTGFLPLSCHFVSILHSFHRLATCIPVWNLQIIRTES